MYEKNVQNIVLFFIDFVILWLQRVCFCVIEQMAKMQTLWLCLFGLCYGLSQAQSMFSVVTNTVLPPDAFHNPTQLNYGMAVTDVDGDGDLEVVVAG